MQYLFTSENIISFIILVILEIVLGIDNVIFVSIIINQLDQKDEKRARRAWMINGIITRSIMLLGLGWLLSQKGKYLFTILDKGFDIASLVMLAGGSSSFINLFVRYTRNSRVKTQISVQKKEKV
jgi:predicted tellurium resistance membrane protein TerC